MDNLAFDSSNKQPSTLVMVCRRDVLFFSWHSIGWRVRPVDAPYIVAFVRKSQQSWIPDSLNSTSHGMCGSNDDFRCCSGSFASSFLDLRNDGGMIRTPRIHHQLLKSSDSITMLTIRAFNVLKEGSNKAWSRGRCISTIGGE